MRPILLLASLSLVAAPAAAQSLSVGGPGGPGSGPPAAATGPAFEFELLDDGLTYAFLVLDEGVSRLCVEMSPSSIGVHVPQFGGAELAATHAGGGVLLSGIHEVGGCTVTGIHEVGGCTVTGIHDVGGCTLTAAGPGPSHAVAALTLDGGAGADLVFDVGPQGNDDDLLAVDLAAPSSLASAVLGGPGGGVSPAGWGPTDVVFDAGTGSSHVALPALGLTVTISPEILVVTGPGGEELFSAAPPTYAFYAPGSTLGYSSDKDILELALSGTAASGIALHGATNGTAISGTTTDLLTLSGTHHGFSLVDSAVGELAASGVVTGYTTLRSSVGSVTGSADFSGQGWNNGGTGGPPPSCPADLDAYGCSTSAQPLFLALGQFGTPPDDNVDGIVCLENGTTTDNCVE